MKRVMPFGIIVGALTLVLGANASASCDCEVKCKYEGSVEDVSGSGANDDACASAAIKNCIARSSKAKVQGGVKYLSDSCGEGESAHGKIGEFTTKQQKDPSEKKDDEEGEVDIGNFK